MRSASFRAWGVSFTGDTGYAAPRRGLLLVRRAVLDGARWNPLSCVPDAGVTGAAIAVRGTGLLVGFPARGAA